MRKQTRFSKKIGIFGGAGPWASAHAVLDIIKKAQWDYHAVEDNEYPELILHSVPLRGFGAKGIEDPDLVKSQLLQRFNRFSAEQVEVALIACNSLHTFHAELQELHPNMNIVSLPEEGAKAVAVQGHQNAGILCSASSLSDNLHKKALEAQGIDVILPTQDQQETINSLIHAVMAGNTGSAEAQPFRKLSREFKDAGAQVLLSGCTELSYLSHTFQAHVPVIDCLYISTSKALELALETN